MGTHKQFVVFLPTAVIFDNIVVCTRLQDVDLNCQIVKRLAFFERDDFQRHNVIGAQKCALATKKRVEPRTKQGARERPLQA